MKLIKTVMLKLNHLPKNWKEWNMMTNFGNYPESDSVSLYSSNFLEAEDFFFIIIIAEKKLNYFKYDDKKPQLSINPIEFELLSLGIETFCDYVSLCENIPRNILSMNPSIFLKAETDDERLILTDNLTLGFNKLNEISRTHVNHKFDFKMCYKNLSDRFDGVKIIAEANSTNNLSGKFREYMRLFERAFKKNNRALILPLLNFLKSNKDFGYDQSEIEKWLEKRNMSVHANNINGFLIEKDLIQIIHRVEQAAYDILFNKLSWHDKSSTRRELYKFKAGLKNPQNDLFFKQNVKEQISMSLFDETSSYYQLLGVSIRPDIPQDWWYERISGPTHGGKTAYVIE